jgi:hypothetical protein
MYNVIQSTENGERTDDRRLVILKTHIMPSELIKVLKVPKS